MEEEIQCTFQYEDKVYNVSQLYSSDCHGRARQPVTDPPEMISYANQEFTSLHNDD